MVIIKMSSNPIAERLETRQADVVRAIVVVEDVEADLILEVAHAQSVALRTATSEEPEFSAGPFDLVNVPEQPVALDESRIRTTCSASTRRGHRATNKASRVEAQASWKC